MPKATKAEISAEGDPEQQQAGAGALEPFPANINVQIDKMNDKINKLLAAMTTFQMNVQTKLSTNEIELKSFQDNIEDKMQNFEYKKSILEVDLATVKKWVRQLPLSGDIDKLFQ